jgi:hypothetical protein
MRTVETHAFTADKNRLPEASNQSLILLFQTEAATMHPAARKLRFLRQEN